MAYSCTETVRENKRSPYHCCVPFCKSDGRYDRTINFHHIPKDQKLRKRWIINIRREEGPFFKISNATVVCSKHFKREDYKSWAPVRKKLKPDVVPSVFKWPNEPRRRTLKRKSPVEIDDKSKTCDQFSPGDVDTSQNLSDLNKETEESGG